MLYEEEGIVFSRKWKENRLSTQQRTHIYLKQVDIAETIFGWALMVQYAHSFILVMKPGVMKKMA